MLGRVELLIVSAKRFVWFSAWYAFQNGVCAFTMAMASTSVSRAFLGVLALVCLVADLLIVVILLRACSLFKYTRVA